MNTLLFKKQIILKKIGLAGQKKIFSANVLIIGLGGLGCPLLTYLAASGVGKIGIVDFDKVEISNLNRQTLFNPNDIGKFKVKQAKKAINKINKKIKIIPFKKKITSKNINKILSSFDIICDGTDNYNTRYLINDYCVKNKKILITGSSGFIGFSLALNLLKKGHKIFGYDSINNYYDVNLKLSRNRLMLSNEEEELIKKIANRLV